VFFLKFPYGLRKNEAQYCWIFRLGSSSPFSIFRITTG